MRPRAERQADLEKRTRAELVNTILALQDTLGWLETSLTRHAEQMRAQTEQNAARTEALKAEETR